MRLSRADDSVSQRSKSIPLDHGAYHYAREPSTPVSKGNNELDHASNAQYLRVPDLVSAKNLTTILNGNEFLVDAHGDLMAGATLDRYIPQEYDGDLIHDDLTDEDRRLAAALVAVQLVNQQKQPAGGQLLPLLTSASLPENSGKVPGSSDHAVVEMPPLLGPNKGESTSLITAALGSSYLQVTNTPHLLTSSSSLQTLPPLKKAIAKSKYLRQINSTTSLESLGLHQEIDDMALTIGGSEVIKTEDIHYMMADDDFENEDEVREVLDSDYDLADQNNRHSLPHKKRIARRLRQPKKQVVVRAKAPRRPNNPTGCTQTPNLMFSCEICFLSFNDQLKFFEHLKSHYEPEHATKPVAVYQTKPLSSQTSSPLSEALRREPKRLVAKASACAFTPTRTVTVVPRNPSAPPAKISPPKASLIPARPPRAKLNVLNLRDLMMKEKPSITQDANKIVQFSSPNLQDIGTTASPLLEGSVVQALWECQHCKRIFRRQKVFENHMATSHQKVEPLEEFSDPEDMNMMAGIKVFVVSDEEKETVREVASIDKEWYGDEELADDFGETTDVMKVEAVMETEEVKPDDVTCEMCKHKFVTKRELNQHIAQAHNVIVNSITKVVRRGGGGAARKGSLKCKECGRQFHHRNSLVYHERSHTGNRAFQCEVCEKGFFARSALKVHMRQHTGVKPFKCDFCSRAFRQWGDLKYHTISIHSDERNYQCEFCGKDFARKYSLTVHSRIHTGERNYKCDFCGKSFRAASYLQNHRRIHTGEKPHECEICGKPFRVRSDMKRHLLTHKDGSAKKYLRPKIEPSASNSNSVDSKFMTEVTEGEPGMDDIPKVEELEVSTVEGILSEETVRASDRLQEELQFIPGEGQREPNTLYFWQVFPT